MGRRFRRQFSRLAILSPFTFSLSLPFSLSRVLPPMRSAQQAPRRKVSAGAERLVGRLFLDPAPLPTPL